MSRIVKKIKKVVKKVGKGIKKVVKKVGKVVKKIAKPLAIAAAIYFTGGAALGAMGSSWGALGSSIMSGAGAVGKGLLGVGKSMLGGLTGGMSGTGTFGSKLMAGAKSLGKSYIKKQLTAKGLGGVMNAFGAQPEDDTSEYDGWFPGGGGGGEGEGGSMLRNPDGSVNWGGALMTGLDAYQSYKGGKDLRDAGNKAAALANPFASQRPYYGEQLKKLQKDPSSIANTPAYKFAQSEGEKSIGRLSAATGKRLSGERMGDVIEFNNNLAGQMFYKEQDRLAALAGSGLSGGGNYIVGGEEAYQGGLGDAAGTIGHAAGYA